MSCWSEEGEKKEEVDAVAEEDRAMVDDCEAASASFFPEVVTAGEGEGSILEVVATSDFLHEDLPPLWTLSRGKLPLVKP